MQRSYPLWNGRRQESVDGFVGGRLYRDRRSCGHNLRSMSRVAAQAASSPVIWLWRLVGYFGDLATRRTKELQDFVMEFHRRAEKAVQITRFSSQRMKRDPLFIATARL